MGIDIQVEIEPEPEPAATVVAAAWENTRATSRYMGRARVRQLGQRERAKEKEKKTKEKQEKEKKAKAKKEKEKKLNEQAKEQEQEQDQAKQKEKEQAKEKEKEKEQEQDEDTYCVLCEESYTTSQNSATMHSHAAAREKVTLDPCNHAFCGHCVQQWRKQTVMKSRVCTTCPLCRAVVRGFDTESGAATQWPQQQQRQTISAWDIPLTSAIRAFQAQS